MELKRAFDAADEMSKVSIENTGQEASSFVSKHAKMERFPKI